MDDTFTFSKIHQMIYSNPDILCTVCRNVNKYYYAELVVSQNLVKTNNETFIGFYLEHSTDLLFHDVKLNRCKIQNIMV